MFKLLNFSKALIYYQKVCHTIIFFKRKDAQEEKIYILLDVYKNN